MYNLKDLKNDIESLDADVQEIYERTENNIDNTELLNSTINEMDKKFNKRVDKLSSLIVEILNYLDVDLEVEPAKEAQIVLKKKKTKK